MQDKYDLHDMNHLPAEMKIEIVRAQTLVDETRKRMKAPGVYLDLTCKTELKNDCAEIERLIRKIRKSRTPEKSRKKLEQAAVRLKTVSEHILHWEYL